ncbi:MAG: outer membrane lipoprotein carrier protein LolA [Bacteroidales bacterium]|nr:outer membrane lipoprotein carrier protein LolA [Bacteroidales bacterium]MDD4656633.1 outer membrane lipoprotein carrier protein LolA [Bacteroidales bacterium]
MISPIKILLLLTLTVGTTTNSPAPDGAKLLDQMAQALKEKKAIELTFELTAADPTGAINGSIDGEVQAQGYSFKLINQEMEIYCDSHSKWILNKQTNELTIFPNDTTQTDMIENPIGFLTSLNSQNSQFNKPRKAVETIEPKGCKPIWQIELSPKNKFAAYKSLIITIEKENHLPCIIRYQSRDDSSYTIHIKSIESQQELWPTTNFQPPPSYLTNKNITITDLR